jgi:hypothetical protein
MEEGTGAQGSHHSARCWLVSAHTKSAISRAELRSTERRYLRCSLLLSGCWPSELATCRGLATSARENMVRHTFSAVRASISLVDR